jgi:hypothetical protein
MLFSVFCVVSILSASSTITGAYIDDQQKCVTVDPTTINTMNYSTSGTVLVDLKSSGSSTITAAQMVSSTSTEAANMKINLNLLPIPVHFINEAVSVFSTTMLDNKPYVCFSSSSKKGEGLNPYALNILSKYNKQGYYEFKLYKDLIHKSIIKNGSNVVPSKSMTLNNIILNTTTLQQIIDAPNSTLSSSEIQIRFYNKDGKYISVLNESLTKLNISDNSTLWVTVFDDSTANALCSYTLGREYQIFHDSLEKATMKKSFIENQSPASVEMMEQPKKAAKTVKGLVAALEDITATAELRKKQVADDKKSINEQDIILLWLLQHILRDINDEL